MTGLPETEIASATAADRDAVIALWRACTLTRPWNDPVADFDSAIGTAASDILLLPEGGAPVAAVMVGFDGHRGWVYYLAVHPDHRRKGLGRRMMDAAEAWLRARGAPKIQLMVRSDNADVIAFYEALGLGRQDVVTLGRRLDGKTGA
ncbi:MAG: GNAT family acetyltransferase [Parasphingopyxis sp.]|uniref:GNAT family acetyltransferase n=1 Tax=Parasphingopyxis sp. TaxID=1920299 RepID=UPI003FA07FE9